MAPNASRQFGRGESQLHFLGFASRGAADGGEHSNARSEADATAMDEMPVGLDDTSGTICKRSRPSASDGDVRQ